MIVKALLKLIYVPFYKSFPTANGTKDVTFEQAGQQPTVRSEMPSAAENFISQDTEDPAGQEKPLSPPGQGTEGAKSGPGTAPVGRGAAGSGSPTRRI